MANGARSTFRVSPEALPRDASGFRAWNRTTVDPYEMDIVHAPRDNRIQRVEGEGGREGTRVTEKLRQIVSSVRLLVWLNVVERTVEEYGARVVYCVKH